MEMKRNVIPRVGLKLGVLGGLGLLVVGCATAPEYAPPEIGTELPAQWTARPEAALAAGSEEAHTNLESEEENSSALVSSMVDLPLLPTGWLETFGDAALEVYVARVMERNLDLQQTALRVESARMQAIISGAGQYPTVALGASAVRSRQPFAMGDGYTGVHTTNYSFDLGLSWELDVWGKVRDGASAALADYEAQVEIWQGTRLSLAAQATRSWFNVITAGLQRDLAAESVRSFEQSADLIRRRFDSGLAGALDLRLALANVANAKASLQSRQQEYESAVRALKVLAGDYPHADLTHTPDLPLLREPVPAGLPSGLLVRRPDLRASERAFAAAVLRTSVAEKQLLPTFALTASGGRSSEELGDLLRADTWLWTLLGNLSQPLVSGGRMRALARQAETEIGRTAAAYASSVLTALSEVEQALSSEGLLEAREVALADAVEQSVAAEDLAWDDYANGIGDIITVLESQRRALDTRAAHINARNLRLQNRVNLYLALGGPFDAVEAEPPSEPLQPPPLVIQP